MKLEPDKVRRIPRHVTIQAPVLIALLGLHATAVAQVTIPGAPGEKLTSLVGPTSINLDVNKATLGFDWVSGGKLEGGDVLEDCHLLPQEEWDECEQTRGLASLDDDHWLSGLHFGLVTGGSSKLLSKTEFRPGVEYGFWFRRVAENPPGGCVGIPVRYRRVTPTPGGSPAYEPDSEGAWVKYRDDRPPLHVGTSEYDMMTVQQRGQELVTQGAFCEGKGYKALAVGGSGSHTRLKVATSVDGVVALDEEVTHQAEFNLGFLWGISESSRLSVSATTQRRWNSTGNKPLEEVCAETQLGVDESGRMVSTRRCDMRLVGETVDDWTVVPRVELVLQRPKPDRLSIGGIAAVSSTLHADADPKLNAALGVFLPPTNRPSQVLIGLLGTVSDMLDANDWGLDFWEDQFEVQLFLAAPLRGF